MSNNVMSDAGSVLEPKAGCKQIFFLTGTRADFGKLKPLIEKVKFAPEFEYQIFVTGMHMLSQYGSTIIEVKRAGFTNFYPYINQDGAISSQMDLVLANTIQGIGHYIREFPPDLIVVHGDRVEALAGAIVGALNNILVAHIEGGEVSGTIDELIRHAVTKLSHLHFVSNEEAQRRLIQMGEMKEAIFVIGSPDIDVMLSDSLPSLSKVKEKYDIFFTNYAIFIFHPVTTEVDSLPHHIDEVIEAALDSERNFVVIHPNNDHGADVILRAFERLRDNPRFRMIPSMRFEYFLTLLKHADLIIGNSSSGIREAPVYGVPTVNIGTRQSNRFNYSSILNVPNDGAQILGALNHLPQVLTPSMHFGIGNSATLFIELLRSEELWKIPKQKQFKDLHQNN